MTTRIAIDVGTTHPIRPEVRQTVAGDEVRLGVFERAGAREVEARGFALPRPFAVAPCRDGVLDAMGTEIL